MLASFTTLQYTKSEEVGLTNSVRSHASMLGADLCSVSQPVDEQNTTG